MAVPEKRGAGWQAAEPLAMCQVRVEDQDAQAQRSKRRLGVPDGPHVTDDLDLAVSRAQRPRAL